MARYQLSTGAGRPVPPQVASLMHTACIPLIPVHCKFRSYGLSRLSEDWLRVCYWLFRKRPRDPQLHSRCTGSAAMRSACLTALVAGLLFVAAVAAQTEGDSGSAQADAITALPAFDEGPEGLYSG